jgi:hypothetical protein
MTQKVAYFRIIKPPEFSHTVIEAGCGDCAGDRAAKLILGPGPYWDGYMEGIDYEVIDARNRAELPGTDIVLKAECPACPCTICQANE